jgi:chromosome segregation protein
VAERLQNGTDRRRRGADERATQQGRAAAAAEELASADADRTEADVALARVREHVSGRQQEEERLRQALGQRREAVRRLEQESQQTIAKQRTLEGERTSREHDLHIQRERATKATDHRGHLRGEQTNTERRRDQLVERVGFLGYESRRAKDRLQDARRLITTTRETDAACRTARRDAEQALAALAARRNALEALERDRVGLAPAAAALLAARAKFGDGILGPLSDYVAVDSADAELAERLLGDLMHAVLVKDASVIDAVRAWHGQAKPGALVLLPVAPGPTITGATAYDARLRVQEPATGWVQAVLAGSEALDETGQVLRRATGAIYLSGAAPQSGPLRRRAELAELAISVAAADAKVAEAEAAQKAVIEQLAAADKALAEAQTAADLADRTERDATAQRDDALRTLANLARELVTAEQELERIGKRITDDANRLTEIADTLTTITTERERAEAALAEARLTLQTIETEQEAAREQRTQAQVEEAQLAARLRTSTDRVARATQTRTDAERNDQRLAEELGRLDGELATLSAQRDEWATTRETIAAELAELESEAGAGEQSYAAAVVALADADRTLQVAREDARRLADESHKLDLARAEAQGLRTRIIERLEQEWRKSIDALFVDFTALDMDFETLENESARITSQLEAIGPVNPLAVEEHAEEAKKVEFLMTQRDDLVSARQSLIQAIREIDGTARQLFIEMFNQIRDNFKLVFQRMFDGGECELRLADPDNPLDCEIEILGAPRGKRIQNVRLLSMGEKTLVATSLLFGLYLTKPSPFCLMDEVDAPLDDANVGRFVRLLEEFKPSTQFLIITHNPRTMQSADAVYGVTMQEPGISTIVGVRLGEAAV